MNIAHYGTPVLIYGAAHWVVIKGYQTDVAPVSGSNPVLQYITIRDPWPPNQGATTTVSGTVWYSDYWYGPVDAPGTWYGYYVAVIEPPTSQGMVYAVEECRIGDTVISPELAVNYADYWKKKIKWDKKDPAFDLLSNSSKKKTQPLTPILVREEINPYLEKDAAVPYYYIVPYALEGEVEAGVVRFCILVNAFTGNFEELTSYDEPIKYLKKEKALEAVALKKGLPMEEAMNAEVDVVFTPCYFSYLRSKPLLRISLNNEVSYVESTCYYDQMMEMADTCVHEYPYDPPDPIYGQ